MIAVLAALMTADPGAVPPLTPTAAGLAISVLLATAGLVGISTIKWRVILRELLDVEPPGTLHLFRSMSLALGLGYLVPQDMAALGIRTWAITSTKAAGTGRSALSVVLDRAFDLLIVLILVVPSSLHLSGALTTPTALSLAAAMMLSGGVMLALWGHQAGHALIRTYGRARQAILARGGLLSRLPLAAPPADPNLRPVSVVTLYGLSSIRFAIVVIRLLLVAWMFDLPIPVELLILGAPLAQITLVVALVPAGLGIYELGWAGVLLTGDIAARDILIFVAGLRILGVASLLVLVATTYLIYWFVETRRRLLDASAAASGPRGR